ncbi:MAG: lactate utilization protein [Clostridiales bacterium]|nr:lactate utilization protein [Clostridiales bacterium]
MSKSQAIIYQRYKNMSEALIKALTRRGYEAYFCENSKEAKEKVMSLIPENATVSWGGTLTLEDMGVLDAVRKGNYKVIDRDTATTPDERTKILKASLTANVYLSSVNAISEDGIMVNIDGLGNRISAIAFGADSVILVVGMNKVCRNAEDAKLRARTYAAPNNGLRLNLTNLPCVKTGFCADCIAPECMCSQIVEMRTCRIPGRIKVVLVGEDLGL